MPDCVPHLLNHSSPCSHTGWVPHPLLIGMISLKLYPNISSQKAFMYIPQKRLGCGGLVHLVPVLGTLSTTTLPHIPLLIFILGLSSLSLNIFGQFCLYLLSLSSQETSVSATKYSYWIITLIYAHDWTLVNFHNYQCCSISEILNPKSPLCPQPATPSSIPRSP